MGVTECPVGASTHFPAEASHCWFLRQARLSLEPVTFSTLKGLVALLVVDWVCACAGNNVAGTATAGRFLRNRAAMACLWSLRYNSGLKRPTCLDTSVDLNQYLIAGREFVSSDIIPNKNR